LVIFTTQEQDRLAFETKLPILIRFKNGLGCCAKRTMVEKNNVGVKEKIFFEGHAFILTGGIG
jgi:hypothetical protein